MIKFDRKCSGKAWSCIENNLHDKLKLLIQPLLAVPIEDKDVNKLRHDECNNNNQMKCKVLVQNLMKKSFSIGLQLLYFLISLKKISYEANLNWKKIYYYLIKILCV